MLFIFGQAFFKKGCATTVAPVDHAIARGKVFIGPFSVKPFLKRAVITPDRVWG
jgi:hypothetical protein